MARDRIADRDGDRVRTDCMWIEVALAVAALAFAEPAAPAERTERIQWLDSTAIGAVGAGRLEDGVQLPAAGPTWFTWDPVLKRSPGRGWRRWGTDDVVRATIDVLGRFRRRHPGAQPVGVGDLSLPRGGYFGPEVGGGIGHATHQNGLDVDVYYPRVDRRLRPPTRVEQVDVARAQELVDLFVAAGATTVYVGPNLPLTGPPAIVTALVNHDNHLHASFAQPRN
jgi:murein endopeptidase